MISVAFLQPAGNLVEIVVSATGAAIAALGIGHFLEGRNYGMEPPVTIGWR